VSRHKLILSLLHYYRVFKRLPQAPENFKIYYRTTKFLGSLYI
jgi:hypothetical protein